MFKKLWNWLLGEHYVPDHKTIREQELQAAERMYPKSKRVTVLR